MAEFTEDEAVKVVPDGEVIGHPQAGLSEEMKNEIGDAENLVFEWQSKYELEVRREAVTAQEEAMMALEAAQNKLKDLEQLIQFGASPRASIFLAIASKALAFIKHRAYVIPEDVRDVGRAILRHRILLTYEAEA